jgi:hypothetical protein
MESLKFWTKKHFDVASYKWGLQERVSKSFNGSGSDNSNKNIYTYNELGFRGDSIDKEGFKIMSVGCSHTEGVEVNDWETWPHYFSKLIPNGVDFNLGFGGRSNDYISRTILTFVDVLNPDVVNIMYTYPSRREYYTNDGNIEPFHTSPWGYFEEDENGKKTFESILNVTNEQEDFINWYKNHLLITNFLQNKKIPYVWNGTFLGDINYTDEFRFDGDYGNKLNGKKHADNKQNEEYSRKLFEFIKNKGIW